MNGFIKKILPVLLLAPAILYAEKTPACFQTMSVREKAAQVLMVGVDRNDYFPAYLHAYFDGLIPGAVLLFGYNMGRTPAVCAEFIASCNTAFYRMAQKHSQSYIPPFITVDAEGGLVYRLRNIGSPLPRAEDVPTHFLPAEARRLYRLTGVQLAAIGVTLNLAPVAECTTPDTNRVLETRTFSEDAAVVSEYAQACINGMRDAGVYCAVKHFPGNGSDDLHTGAAVISADWETFQQEYLTPFIPLIQSQTDVILVSHAVFSAVDNRPFCFSKKGLTDILRGQLGYTGLIITDDMAMKALTKNGSTSEQNVLRALRAGCDMVMCSKPIFPQLVDAISAEALKNAAFARRLDNAVLRILALKSRGGLFASDAAPSVQADNIHAFYQAKKEAAQLVYEKMGGPQ